MTVYIWQEYGANSRLTIDYMSCYCLCPINCTLTGINSPRVYVSFVTTSILPVFDTPLLLIHFSKCNTVATLIHQIICGSLSSGSVPTDLAYTLTPLFPLILKLPTCTNPSTTTYTVSTLNSLPYCCYHRLMIYTPPIRLLQQHTILYPRQQSY